MKARRIERGAALAIGALVVAVALFAPIAKSREDSDTRSAESTKPTGRRALFLLLSELGFAPQVWRNAPDRLPDGRHVLWMPQAPDNADDEILGAAENYRRFLNGGGTIVIAATPRNVKFLVDDLHQTACEGLAIGESAGETHAADDAQDEQGGEHDAKEEDTDAPAGEENVAPTIGPAPFRCDTSTTQVSTRDGETWNALWPHWNSWLLEDLDRDTLDAWTIQCNEERAILALIPAGAGSIALLANDAFLDNEHLPDADHAVLAERLVELVHGDGQLLFDEYALGSWDPQTALGLATSPRILPLTVQLVLVFLLFAWRRVWTGRFPRDPEPTAALSPLSRARALAAVYERAGRTHILAGFLREGVLRRVRTRLRVRADAPIAAVSQRSGALDAARFEHAFAPRRVASSDELDALGRELASVEAELDATLVRRGTRAR